MFFSLKFGIQYRNCPNFISYKYCLGSTLLNFSDRTRTGVFSLIWPLALGRSKIRLCLWSWQSFDRNYDFRHRYFSFISVFCCLKFGIQYRNCPNFISYKYWLGSTLLNFSDRTRTGVFSLIWPLALGRSKSDIGIKRDQRLYFTKNTFIEDCLDLTIPGKLKCQNLLSTANLTNSYDTMLLFTHFPDFILSQVTLKWLDLSLFHYISLVLFSLHQRTENYVHISNISWYIGWW